MKNYKDRAEDLKMRHRNIAEKDFWYNSSTPVVLAIGVLIDAVLLVGEAIQDKSKEDK